MHFLSKVRLILSEIGNRLSLQKVPQFVALEGDLIMVMLLPASML